jgi:glyoxylate reductase
LPDRVFVTYPIPDPGLQLLRERFEVKVFEADRAPTRDEMIAGAAGCSGVLSLVRDPVDDALLAALPAVRAVANYGVGYDNIDVPAATVRGVMVTNTPDVLTDATADLTLALILAVARRIGEGERMVRSGRFKGWDPKMLLGADVFGATLGLVGFGRIGQAVARRARSFEMRMLYFSRHEVGVAHALGARRVTLDELLEQSDFVSVHVALNKHTRHLLDQTALRRMKPTSYLVNTARGSVVDEKALVRALREGWIAGAGLDVYEREPDLSSGLTELENVVLLPHLGSATVRARSEMARVAATNLVAALSGETPPNLVNPEVLETRHASA